MLGAWGAHQLPVVVSKTLVALVVHWPVPQHGLPCFLGLNSAPAGMSDLSLMFSVKPWLVPPVVEESVAPPSQPCCRLTSPHAVPAMFSSTHVAGRDSPRCTVPAQPLLRDTNLVSPLLTVTALSLVRL